MRAYAEIRRAAKWAGAAVLVSLAAAWTVSGWVWIRVHSSSGPHASLIRGALRVGYEDPETASVFRSGWRVVTHKHAIDWWFYFVRTDGQDYVGVPLWVLAVPVAILSAAAWRLDAVARRQR